MKTTIFCALLAVALGSCGNATDGDARTDTTRLMVDTGAVDAVNDTAAHVNTNTGQYPTDTTNPPGKTDVRSSAPSNPATRSTTPGNDTMRRKQ
ncbi:hypothetical protein [Flaviaesturariibacter terrae]